MLSNGLPVLSCHTPGRRLAAFHLVIHVGASQEPEGYDGLAQIAAQSLIEDGAGEWGSRVERLGATLGVSAGLASTRIVMSVPAGRLHGALDVLFEALSGSRVNAGNVEPLVRTQCEVVRREGIDPRRRAKAELYAALFDPGERAARRIGGSSETLARIDVAAVEDFRRRFYGPDNATSVIACEMPSDRLGRVLADRLGRWHAPALPYRRLNPPRAAGEPGLTIVHRPDAPQTELALGHLLPDPRHPEWAALKVAAHVLGGGLDSRLNMKLRERKAYSYGFSAAAEPLPQAGLLFIRGSVARARSVDAVADILAELSRTAEEGVRQDECQTSVDKLVRGAYTRFETTGQIAAKLARTAAGGLPDDEAGQHLLALAAQDRDTVSTALARHLSIARLAVVAVGDAHKIYAPLEQLCGRPAKLVDPEAYGTHP
ncbi:M16 family metallopeptidase [Sphaerimonospora sp. CA-214678]|uniref:M16 family metallopeptidase n=1 Tax=Sphaerimonospora sp. CA-214678 TaxID=3240029 RepID=UPI003D8CCE6B